MNHFKNFKKETTYGDVGLYPGLVGEYCGLVGEYPGDEGDIPPTKLGLVGAYVGLKRYHKK